MAKLESTFKNMALSLTSITLVAAVALGCVYLFTTEQIEQQKLATQNAASVAVLNGQEGTPVEVSVNGFGGTMRVMVGFAPDGTILGYEVLEHSETPGLGDKSTTWFKNADKPGQCIIGRQATGNFTVSKDGGDVDAITAATISSRAFLKAVNDAYAQFQQDNGIEVQVEATSGANQMMQPQSEKIEEKEANNE